MPLEKKNDDDDAYLSCDNAEDVTFVPPVIFPEKLSDGRWVSGDLILMENLIANISQECSSTNSN